MERYNIIEIDEKPGTRIIQTDAYRHLIANQPGLIHDNSGDFYSQVHLEDLSNVVHSCLENAFKEVNLDFRIQVEDSDKFDYDTANGLYLINEKEGFKIYSTKQESESFKGLIHKLIPLAILDNLITTEKMGTITEIYFEIKKEIPNKLKSLETASWKSRV